MRLFKKKSENVPSEKRLILSRPTIVVGGRQTKKITLNRPNVELK